MRERFILASFWGSSPVVDAITFDAVARQLTMVEGRSRLFILQPGSERGRDQGMPLMTSPGVFILGYAS